MDIKIKVAVVVVNQKNQVLLIKEKNFKNKYFWNVVKGTHDPKDKDVLFTAKRECKEEINAKIKITDCLGIYISKNNTKTRIQFNFLGKLTSNNLTDLNTKNQKNDEKISELKWFTKNEVKKLIPADFFSFRAYQLIQDWTKGVEFPLAIIKKVKL
jgi:ADP-ribose pyrophosphatase YjhB (NUDIX family)